MTGYSKPRTTNHGRDCAGRATSAALVQAVPADLSVIVFGTEAGRRHSWLPLVGSEPPLI